MIPNWRTGFVAGTVHWAPPIKAKKKNMFSKLFFLVGVIVILKWGLPELGGPLVELFVLAVEILRQVLENLSGPYA